MCRQIQVNINEPFKIRFILITKFYVKRWSKSQSRKRSLCYICLSLRFLMIFLFKARSDLYWFLCPPSDRFKATSHPGRLSLLRALPYSHLYLGSVGLELEADSVIGHFHLEATGRVVVLLAESALHRILKGIKTFFCKRWHQYDQETCWERNLRRIKIWNFFTWSKNKTHS